ncbi:hypothetical protein C922_03938 [Plasmodium inui San Antonio 1]|uniref:Uncharacterized protein n=1 Tax=Plasmodium inui San Antonio 1 TaxID=1237626 RepID=W7A1Z7_9APIC|nr:hypothetical protein C922_03938 [Plasmodium inui San Antonio 1]EUD65690.1 hypothetical protein C922_03938 [Plasmodium inui San Antonio 1]
MNDEKKFDFGLDQSTASNGLFTVIERKPLSSLGNNESLNLSNLSDPLSNSIDGVNKKAKDYSTQNTDNICEIYRLNTSQLLNEHPENTVSRISYVDDDVSSFYDSEKEDEFYFDNDISTLGSCYSVPSPTKISKGKKARTSIVASVSKRYSVGRRSDGGRASDAGRSKQNPFFDPTFSNDSPVSGNQFGKNPDGRDPSRYTQSYGRDDRRTRLTTIDASNESLQNDENSEEEAQFGKRNYDDELGQSQNSNDEKAIRVNKNVYRIVNLAKAGDDDKETVIRRIAQVRKSMMREKRAGEEGHAEGAEEAEYAHYADDADYVDHADHAEGESPPHYDPAWNVSKLRELRTGKGAPPKGAFREDPQGERSNNRFSEGNYLRQNDKFSRYNSDRRVKYIEAKDQGGDVYMQGHRGGDNYGESDYQDESSYYSYEGTEEVKPSGDSQFKKRKKHMFLPKQPGQGTSSDAQKCLRSENQDEVSHQYLHGNGLHEKRQVRSSRPFGDLPEDIVGGRASFQGSEANVDLTCSTEGGMGHGEEDTFQSGGAPHRGRYGDGHFGNARERGGSGNGENTSHRAYRIHQYSGIAKGYHRVARVRRDTGLGADGNANVEADERYGIDEREEEGVDDSNHQQMNRRMHHANKQNRQQYMDEDVPPPRSMHMNGYDKTHKGKYPQGNYSYEDEKNMVGPKQDELFPGDVYPPARDMHSAEEGDATTYFRSAHSRGYRKVRGEEDPDKEGDEEANYKNSMYRNGRHPVGMWGANQGRMGDQYEVDYRHHVDDRYHAGDSSFTDYRYGSSSSNTHPYHRGEYMRGVNQSYRRQDSSENQIRAYPRGGNRKYDQRNDGDPHAGDDGLDSYGVPHEGSHYHSGYSPIHQRSSYEGEDYYDEEFHPHREPSSDQGDYYDPRAMSYEHYRELHTDDQQRNAFSKRTPPNSQNVTKPYFDEGANRRSDNPANVSYQQGEGKHCTLDDKRTRLNEDDMDGDHPKVNLNGQSATPPTVVSDAPVLSNKSTNPLSDVKENTTGEANMPNENATNATSVTMVGTTLPLQIVTQSTTQGVSPAVQANQPGKEEPQQVQSQPLAQPLPTQPPVKRKRGRPKVKKTTTPSEEATSVDPHSNVASAKGMAVPTMQLNNQTGAPASGPSGNVTSEQNHPPLYNNMGSVINPPYNNQMSNPNAHLQMAMEHPSSYQLGGPTQVLGQPLGQLIGQPLGQTLGHPLADPHNTQNQLNQITQMNQLNQMNPLSAHLAQQMGLPVGQHLNPQVGQHIGQQMGQQLSQMHTQMSQHMNQQMNQHMNQQANHQMKQQISHHNGYLLPTGANNHFGANMNEDQYTRTYASFEPDVANHADPTFCNRHFEQARNNRDNLSYEGDDGGEYQTNKRRITRSDGTGSEERHSEKEIKKGQRRRRRRRKNEMDQADTHYKKSSSSSNQSNVNHAESKSVESYRNKSNDDSNSRSEHRADQDFSTFLDENNKLVSYRVAYNPADTVWERLSGVKIGPLILTAQSRTTNVILAKNRSIELGNINHNLIYGYIYKGDNVRLSIGKETRSVKTGSLFFLPSYNDCSIHNDDA